MGNQAFIRATKFTGLVARLLEMDNLEFFLISSTDIFL